MDSKKFLFGMSPKIGLVVVATLSIVSLIGALISQHMFGMQPCAWCILQRLMFVIIAMLSIIFIFVEKNNKISFVFLIFLATLGLAASLYQNFVAAKSFDCNVSIAEKIISSLKLNEFIPEVFGIFALCADKTPKLLGIDYSWIGFIMFAIISDILALSLISLIRNSKN
jgi:disulfide bond formation protein DsbB